LDDASSVAHLLAPGGGNAGLVGECCGVVVSSGNRTETQSRQMVRNFHQLFSGIEFLQAVNADPNCPRNSAP
jgi:hypothetical protein